MYKLQWQNMSDKLSEECRKSFTKIRTETWKINKMIAGSLQVWVGRRSSWVFWESILKQYVHICGYIKHTSKFGWLKSVHSNLNSVWSEYKIYVKEWQEMKLDRCACPHHWGPWMPCWVYNLSPKHWKGIKENTKIHLAPRQSISSDILWIQTIFSK